MELFTLCLTLLAVTLGVHSQQFTQRRSSRVGDCPRPDANVIAALISDSFNLADGAERPVVNVNESVVVCESPGLFRDTVSSFSAVVSYSCMGDPAPCDGNLRTDQFQYDCNSDNTFTRADIASGRIRTPMENVVATLETPLNAQCGQCSEPTAFLPAAAEDHCVGK